jgi:hypothetical protein
MMGISLIIVCIRRRGWGLRFLTVVGNTKNRAYILLFDLSKTAIKSRKDLFSKLDIKLNLEEFNSM